MTETEFINKYTAGYPTIINVTDSQQWAELRNSGVDSPDVVWLFRDVCGVFVTGVAGRLLFIHSDGIELFGDLSAYTYGGSAISRGSTRLVAHKATMLQLYDRAAAYVYDCQSLYAYDTTIAHIYRSSATTFNKPTIYAHQHNQIKAFGEATIHICGRGNRVCVHSHSVVHLAHDAVALLNQSSTALVTGKWTGSAILQNNTMLRKLSTVSFSSVNYLVARDEAILDLGHCDNPETVAKNNLQGRAILHTRDLHLWCNTALNQSSSVVDWIEYNGGTIHNNKVIVYKAVSHNFKTQEGTRNETHWEIDKTLEVPDWDVTEECGEGKFHACWYPADCWGFRYDRLAKLIAIQVEVNDLYRFISPVFPNKLAFRKGKVLYEVDANGIPI